MGGVVNVAIRLQDGRAFCQERSTNNMPYWFKNPRMFDGNEDHILGYVNMCANNNWNEDRYCLGLPKSVENSEYGLIVWDFKTNVILDNNHYSNPTRFHAGLLKTNNDEGFWDLVDSNRIKLRVYTDTSEPGQLKTVQQIEYDI